jgi:uncharacterized protein YbaR (Trm112 family)
MERPIKFLKMNQCMCEGMLELVENETYKADLNPQGIPLDGVSVVDMKLICKNCGRVYDAKKVGMFYVADSGLPKIQKIVKDYNPFYQ